MTRSRVFFGCAVAFLAGCSLCFQTTVRALIPIDEITRTNVTVSPFGASNNTKVTRSYLDDVKVTNVTPSLLGGFNRTKVKHPLGENNSKDCTHNRLAGLNRRNGARNQNTSLLYVHIPKAGGTRLKDYSDVLLTQRCHKYTKSRCSVYHVPPAWFVPERGPYLEHTSFTLIRNPYDRMLSQYFWSCAYGRQTHRLVLGVIISKARVDIATCRANVTQLNIVLQWMLSKTVTRETATDFAADCHFVPQSVFVVGVDHVFCRMEDVKLFLLQHGMDKKTMLHLHELKPHNRSVLTATSKKLIQAVYAADFTLLRRCASAEKLGSTSVGVHA